MADQLAKSLVDAAMELHRRRPWTRVQADAPILLRVPDEPHPVVATIIGQDRSDYGLVLLRGEDALACFQRMMGEEDQAALASDGDMLGLSFDPLSSIPPELRELLRAAGFSARREQAAPLVYVKRPEKRARAPGRHDMRLLLACLRAILAADDAGEFAPVTLDEPDRILEIRLHKERSKGEPPVTVSRVSWPGPRFDVPTSGLVALDPELASLPRLDERWHAATSVLPVGIRGSDRLIHGFSLFDDASELILGSQIMEGLDAEAVCEVLESVSRGNRPTGARGLPREIAFSSRSLHDALAPALADLGVRTSVGEEPEWVREAMTGLAEVLGGDLEPRGSGSMEFWKAADRRVIQLFAGEGVVGMLENEVALKRYFGGQPIAVTLLSEMQDLGPIGAFVEWFIADFRPRKGVPTVVELALGRPELAQEERVLLEARAKARLSIFRVDRCEPGSALDVEDVLSGARHHLNDQAMSGCNLEGYFLPLRLLKVGGWTFPSIAGPPLGAALVDRALAYLEELGAKPSRLGLRRHADLIGRLWEWTRVQQAQRPVLQNTDGEPLELTRATFVVGQIEVLHAALKKRRDVGMDLDGRWSWTRPDRQQRGSRTVLAHLELIDDRLLVDVNSAGRLKRVRAWLEKIPGVHFESARQLDIDDERPLDDQLPDPNEPELEPAQREAVEQMYLRHCRRWLDEPVPALGNLTPREACKSADGRQRVARLIRSMPDVPAPWGTMQPPREELLRELGIRR